MISFSNYENIQLVHEGPSATLYTGVRTVDKETVIIKLLKQESNLAELASLQSKKTLDFHHYCILKPTELLFIDQHLGFVYLDQNLISLRQIQKESLLNVVQILTLSQSIAQELFNLHQNSIIHKDLRPGNILTEPDHQKIRFIGYEGYEHKPKYSLRHANTKDHYFDYTPPEALNKKHQNLTPQSDLYSLGAILYELLSGKPPFEQDSQTGRQNRLTSRPKALYTICPHLPRTLCKIIDKLLSPNPKERYGNAKRLAEDFAHILRQVSNHLEVIDFEPGKGARSREFIIPNKLYGAEKNERILYDAWQSIVSGGVEFFLIQGMAGLGKTSQVLSIRSTVVQSGGFFIHVKLDNIHKDTPYYSIQKVFIGLITQVISQEEDDKIHHLKDQLVHNLGANAQVMIDFVPELAFIIGPQDPIPSLDSTETQKRFLHCCIKFLQSFANTALPILTFIDNFHWADTGSIQLFQDLLTSTSTRYLLVIVAFRETKVFHHNKLQFALEEIRKAEVTLQELTVTPMSLEDIIELLYDSLGTDQDFKELADLILQKTEGNPFFVKQTLQFLYEDELIRFHQEENTWSWDLQKIHNAALSDNVITLMTNKIQKFSDPEINLLVLASCIGSKFTLQHLHGLTEQSYEEIKNNLTQAFKAGFILKNFEFMDFDNPGNKAFHFMHSRVWQATYNLQIPEQKKRNHLQIGRMLLSQKKDLTQATEKEVFTIVNHLNQAIQLLEDKTEKNQLADLNYKAGNFSKMSAAYEAAWRYYTLGVNLLSSDSWETHYELTKGLYLKAAESEYYSGNRDSITPYFDFVEAHVKNQEEQLEVALSKIQLYIKSSKYQEALEIGLEYLQRFYDKTYPPNDAELNIMAEIQMSDLVQELNPVMIENLQFLPEMQEGIDAKVIFFISQLIPAVYVAKPSLWVIFTIYVIRLSREKGNTKSSPLAYMHLAVLLCSGMGDYKTGFAMAKLALTLNKKFQNFELEAQLNFLFGSFINQWQNPAKDSLTFLKQSYDEGMQCGDLHTAANALQYTLAYLPMIGAPIEDIQREIQLNQDFSTQLKSQDLFNTIEISKLFLQLYEKKTETNQNQNLEGSEKLQKSLEEQNSPVIKQLYYLVVAQIQFHLGKASHALKLIEKADAIATRYAKFSDPELIFYHSLILLKNYPHMGLEEKKRSWDRLKTNQNRLQNWAESCPLNYADKHLLVSAEIAGVSGNFMDAMNLYDQAVQAASKGGFIQNEALANELAARYYHLKHKETPAKAYLKEAFTAYIKWGGTQKLIKLEKEFSRLLHFETTNLDEINKTTPQPQDQGEIIDYPTLQLSLDTISLEVEPTKLYKKAIKTLLDPSGAQLGYLLISESGKMILKAQANFDRENHFTLCDIAFEEFTDISHSTISFCQRTKRQVLLTNPKEEHFTARDEYVQSKNPLSILCIPLLLRGELLGMLYLENNLTPHAFNPSRVELLNFLCNMVALAMENTKIYGSLADTTEELGIQKQELNQKIAELNQKINDN